MMNLWTEKKKLLKPLWEMYDPMLFPLDIYKHSIVVDMMEDPPVWFATLEKEFNIEDLKNFGDDTHLPYIIAKIDPGSGEIDLSHIDLLCPNCGYTYFINLEKP